MLQRCHNCGALNDHKVYRAHGLFCSKACEDADAAKQKQVSVDLINAGFVKHSSIQNLWTKDGVTLSQEQVHRGNLQQLLAKHQTVVRSASARA